jgi:hypothetical protein
MLRQRLVALGMSTRTARTAALFQLAGDLPAGLLARCLGIDISSAVDWQRAAAGDWHGYATRTALERTSAVDDGTAQRLGRPTLR